MGMFDEYVPDPPLTCQRCGNIIDLLQGKEGPQQLYTYIQGSGGPVRRTPRGDTPIVGDELAAALLPASFLMYGECECGQWINARGTCVDGVWVETVRVSGEPACTCVPSCSTGCTGACGCEKCRQDYNDDLSVDYD